MKKVVVSGICAALMGTSLLAQSTFAEQNNNSSEKHVKSFAVSASTSTSQIIDFAKKQVGKPYVFGASGPNAFDCSGFIYYVLKNNGVNISRTSVAGYWDSNVIQKVSNPRPGDLIFLQNTYKPGPSHVGIMINDTEFVHAADEKTGVTISNKNSSYNKQHFLGYGRVAGVVDNGGVEENKEPSGWAKDAWNWGLHKGIVDGNSHPHGIVKEEILIHMLQRVYNNKVFSGNGSTVSVAADTSYRNGEPSDWARDAWKWGLEKGIIDGNSHPHGEVKEEILVHMLQRVYNNKVFSGNGSTVSVAADTSYRNGEPSDWARDAWKWGLEKGIIDGNSHPHGEVTEEILVHILQRCANNGVFK
ncbi:MULTISPECIES: C40 family peptidase [Bacillus]|uniref:C40 family peptidase n=1 Tax=Bacillus TaxID=1386 RepID=UPI0002E5B188|nr:C40 family peptidase [Bacillus pseudomycoides]MED1594158.1 C40 family peptidase [Bacillus pseudomycoides]MED4714515.1 C40 family peptidase [Bacillus pseudomycoides]